MLGGTVVAIVKEEDSVRVVCRQKYYKGEMQVIELQKTAEAREISNGDDLYWDDAGAYWTPLKLDGTPARLLNDIKIPMKEEQNG